MKSIHLLLRPLIALLVLALSGCTGGQPVIAEAGKLTSLDQRPSLANPLKAAQATPKAATVRPGRSQKSLH